MRSLIVLSGYRAALSFARAWYDYPPIGHCNATCEAVRKLRPSMGDGERTIAPLQNHTGSVDAVAFSPDSRRRDVLALNSNYRYRSITPKLASHSTA
jgi:hypothetical protein